MTATPRSGLPRPTVRERFTSRIGENRPNARVSPTPGEQHQVQLGIHGHDEASRRVGVGVEAPHEPGDEGEARVVAADPGRSEVQLEGHGATHEPAVAEERRHVVLESAERTAGRAVRDGRAHEGGQVVRGRVLGGEETGAGEDGQAGESQGPRATRPHGGPILSP